MKKFLFLAAFACCSAPMTAQNQKGELSIKPMAGVNLSNFSNATYDIYHIRIGFTGGAELEYGVTPRFGLSLGLLYSQQGAKIDGIAEGMAIDDNGNRWHVTSDMNGKLKCSYLNLPLMANFYIPSIKGLSIKAGIQVGILTSDRISAETMAAMKNLDYPQGITSVPTDGSNPRTQLISYNTDMSDVCKSVDFGIPVGLSYEYKNIVLDTRYFFGLTKIDKTDNPDSARNQYLSITLGYKFHL